MTYNVMVTTLLNHPRLYLVALMLAAFPAVQAATQPAQGASLDHGLFTIEYAPGQEAVARQTLTILEDAVREYAPMLPAGEAPIRVVIAELQEEFDRYAVHFTGLNVSGLARPQHDLIIVKAPRLRMPGSDYPGTLRHELVHLLLYRNVDYRHLPQWLNEGIAMSLANEFYWQSMFKVARMFIQNRVIPYESLENAFRAPADQFEFNDAYAQALSMTRHLRNKLGDELFWTTIRQLREEPFHQALQTVAGISLQEFWSGYEGALWKYALVAGMASGFFFQPAAILLIIAYIRRRRIARDLYRRWEAEDAAEASSGIAVPDWEMLVEDPDAWKQDIDDDDEEDDTW